MKCLTTKILAFATYLALIGLLTASAFAQIEPVGTPGSNLDKTLQIQKQNTGKDIDPKLILVNKRPPILFKSFEVRDPKTGTAISPDTVLTLPDGKQVKAGEYYATLNKIEAGLNAQGYSLREKWKSLTIQKSVLNETALQSQARSIRARLDLTKPFRKMSSEEFKGKVKERIDSAQTDRMIKLINDTLIRQPVIVPKVIDKAKKLAESIITSTTHTVEEYPFEIGDPKLFAAYVYSKLELNGSKDNMQLVGEAKAGCSMFGNRADLLRLSGTVNAPRKGNMTGNVALDVLPFGTVYNLPLDGASISKTDELTKSLDIELADFRVMVGPVPVRIKAGVRGSAGFRYNVALNPSAAVAEFTPFIYSKAYAQASVDLVVLGAGVGADLTLLNYDLSMYGSVHLWEQTPKGGRQKMLGIGEEYQVSHRLQTLNGKMYAFAYIYVPAFDIPPWEKKEWQWDIFSWNGFTPVDGTFVENVKFTSFGIPSNYK